MSRSVKQTKASFDYQWKYLNFGSHLTADKSFIPEEFIQQEIGRQAEWFQGKDIIDVGCGSGRWSIGFKKLGANIFSVDQSQSATKILQEHGIKSKQIDLFEITKGEFGEFDVVWSWGVLHHTGDTYKAFQTVSKLVKKGGTLHVMIYNKKALRAKFWRKALRIFPGKIKTKVISVMMWWVRRHRIFRAVFPVHPTKLHGNFDALSPSINSEHSEKEVTGWFEMEGYKNIVRRYPEWIFNEPNPSADIIINGVKT